MQNKKNITRSITWFAGIVIGVIVIIFPLGYFFISYQYLAGNLDIETETNARLITRIISANPEMWEFQQLRIQESLSLRPMEGYPEIRRVLNTKSELVAESVDVLKTPFIMHSDELLDSGVVAGRIEIYRSLRPLLIQTGLVASCMLPIGLGTFLILRNLPIRTIFRAEDALQRNKEVAEQLASENAIMAEIGRIIGSTLDIQEVYEHFAEEVYKLISFDRIAINAPVFKENIITTLYVSGLSVQMRQPGAANALSGSLTETVLRRKQSSLIQMENKDELIRTFPRLLGFFNSGLRSFISVPLISKNEAIGVLHLQSTKPNAYTEMDVRLTERVANQIAGAIANTQLFVELAQAEERQKKLVHELQDALAKVKTLSGFLPICASCKKIRDDKGYWNQVESYVSDHSEATFTHGICPECMKKLYPDFANEEK